MSERMRVPRAFVVWFVLCWAGGASAQPSEGSFLDLSAGLGLSAPYDDTGVSAIGALAKVEYALVPHAFFGIRPYLAALLTWPSGEDERCAQRGRQCEVAARVAMLGGKLRVALPLPLVAPFLEAGLGGSLGLLRTQTLSHAIEETAPTYHIPLALGAALGPDHALELAFGFYFHPVARQRSAGATAGLSLRLGGRRAR